MIYDDKNRQECNCSIEVLMKSGCQCEHSQSITEEKSLHYSGLPIGHPIVTVMTEGIIMVPAQRNISSGDISYIGDIVIGIVLNTVKVNENCQIRLAMNVNDTNINF